MIAPRWIGLEGAPNTTHETIGIRGCKFVFKFNVDVDNGELISIIRRASCEMKFLPDGD